MPSEKNPISAAQRVQNSLQQLSTAAPSLNEASDKLGKGVGELESALKKMNLGVESWFHFNNARSDDGMSYSYDGIGYCKTNGKWGISLSHGWGDERADGDTVECWPFNEAPRLHRLNAVRYIPDLLEKMNKDVEAMVKQANQKAVELDSITTAINAASGFAS